MDERFGNLLLDSLPGAERELLEPLLSERHIGRYEGIHRQGERIELVCFPRTALLSSTTSVEEGAMVEAVTTGREGMVGLPIFLGVEVASMNEMGQVPGTMWQAKAAEFASVLPGLPSLRRSLGLYTDAVMKLLSQTVACNRLHPIDGRCARWLLMTEDRVRSPVLNLTHQVLADMLGATRPTVSLALQHLRAAGSITIGRGEVVVSNRELLESLSCECYAEIRKRFAGLQASIGQGSEAKGGAAALPGTPANYGMGRAN